MENPKQQLRVVSSSTIFMVLSGHSTLERVELLFIGVDGQETSHNGTTGHATDDFGHQPLLAQSVRWREETS